MPRSILKRSLKKQCFPKWPSSVPDKHEIFFCGAILTNKRSILTNLGMGIPFLTFCLNLKHIFDHELKMAAANSVIQKQIEHFHSVGLFCLIKRQI